MDNDILREAVELADGWVVEHDKITRGYVQSPLSDPSRMMLAGLASQLISQVDAMEGYEFESDDCGWASIWECPPHSVLSRIVVSDGPNRDENSIIACVEFLRGLK